jgi:hypothetical protein
MFCLFNKSIISFTFLLVFSYSVFAQDVTQSVLKDPSISLQCKALLRERREKLKIKQKTQAMMQRNKKLSKKVPNNKKSLLIKVKTVSNKLNQIFMINKLQLRVIEEDIIKKGCPGVNL